MTTSQSYPTQRLFGRRKGRPLRVRKSRLMQELLPQLEIKLAPGEPLDPKTLFLPAPASALWCEIGFGGGEHLAAQAKRHPEIGFIGCEPFVNGVASLLDHLERDTIENVRIYAGDARDVLDVLPAGSLARIYVLFADPWPKSRHAERRFIGPENLPRLARALEPGGELLLATDVTGLAEWMREAVAQQAEFEPLAIGPQPPANWIATRYEEKGRAAGRLPVYFSYRRR